jgi:hypothetical protein
MEKIKPASKLFDPIAGVAELFGRMMTLRWLGAITLVTIIVFEFTCMIISARGLCLCFR